MWKSILKFLAKVFKKEAEQAVEAAANKAKSEIEKVSK
jgi:hypothetical protein